MSAKLDDVDPKFRRILLAYPVRTKVRWYRKKGTAVIVYRKDLSKFEKRLQDVLGGPDDVRRTMDEKATMIWVLSDGRHTVKDICDTLYEKYREEIEPVFEYVHKVLVVLLERGLLRLEENRPERPLPVRRQRVLRR